MSGSQKTELSNCSAGLLLFRPRHQQLEVLLAHPGGPFWKYRDEGAWTIPKGLIHEGEDNLAAACREFEEETGIRPIGPFIPLGSIQQKAGKMIYGWAWKGNVDASQTRSNWIRTEWPKKSGNWIHFPEVDRCEWFDTNMARQRINPAQIPFLTQLEDWWQSQGNLPA